VSAWHSNGRNNMGEFQTVLRTPGAQERWMHYCSLSEKDKRKWLKENRVTDTPEERRMPRANGSGRPSGRPRTVTADMAAEMRRLKDEGWSLARLAVKFDVCKRTVVNRLKVAPERPADSLADRESARSAKK
jgi:hypothetical protein